jgi:hypothetical protein
MNSRRFFTDEMKPRHGPVRGHEQDAVFSSAMKNKAEFSAGPLVDPVHPRSGDERRKLCNDLLENLKIHTPLHVGHCFKFCISHIGCTDTIFVLTALAGLYAPGE